jgi:hypothetical protein
MDTQLKGNILSKLGNWGSLQSSHTSQELRLMTLSVLEDAELDAGTGGMLARYKRTKLSTVACSS